MIDQTCNSDFLRDIAFRAARRLMSYDWKIWFWGDSIGLEGLLDVSDLLRDKQFEAFVYGLLKAWVARRKSAQRWDYTAPGLALLRSYERTLDCQLLKLARQHANYLAADFRRTQEGAYVRCEDPDLDLPPELPADDPQARSFVDRRSVATKAGPCIFVDNMHFDGPFYAKLHEVTADQKWRALANTNIIGSIRLLFDENRDLFHHFWIQKVKKRNGIFWGRGQGWALLGLVHTLQNLDEYDPAHPVLLEVLRRHSRAMAHFQDPSGHWRTIIDDQGSYLEHSIAGFVVDSFSRAIMRNWIDDAYRNVVIRAMSALVQQVKEDGTLGGVSYETYPSIRPEHYRMMPRGAMVPWGQGTLIAAIRSYVALVNS